MQSLILAGGCFWGVEAYFRRVKGVSNTLVGYTGGHTINPDYTKIKVGNTGHVEACKIEYDNSIITLKRLLHHFFRIIEPTSLNKQGNDIGSQYVTALYYKDEDEKDIMTAYISLEQQKHKKPIVVKVLPEATFYIAEDYHQNYLEKNPGGYCHIDIDSLRNDEMI